MSFVSGNIYDVLTLDELVSGNHGEKRIENWVELDDVELNKLSTLFLNPSEYDDKTAFNFTNSEFNYKEVFDEEYLREKFPGFDDLTYGVLKAEAEALSVEKLFINPDDKPKVKPSADSRRGDEATKINILA